MITRKQRVRQAYQHGEELSVNSKRYQRTLQTYIDSFLEQDTEDVGDITYRSLFNGEQGKSIIEMKQPGIIAGVEETKYIMELFKIGYQNGTLDGEEVKEGQAVLRKEGKLEDILTTERLGLNILQRMSGIATRTRELADIAGRYGCQIAATRKTDLGLIDKKAAYIGGALTHRLGLYDAVMIKDTHIDQLARQNDHSTQDAITEAVQKCYEQNPEARFIEVEVRDKEQALLAAKTYHKLAKRPGQEFIIMLDNFSPEEITETIKELKEKHLYNTALLEASGGINEKNLENYARTGIDVVSMGTLTSEVDKLDIHEVCLN